MRPICPYVRRAWYDILKPNTYIRERMIFDYEIMYINEGTGIVTVDSTVYTAAQGDVYIFKPRQRHSIHLLGTDTLVQPHVHFDLYYRPNREEVPISFKNLEEMTEDEKRLFHEDISEDFVANFPNHIHLNAPNYFEQLLYDVIYAFNNPGNYWEITMQWLFLRLWTYLLNEINYQKPRKKQNRQEHLANVKAYIEQNLNRRVTLDELCQIAHFSKCYLNKLFQVDYKTSPLAYHNLLRIEKAKNLICYTNTPLQNIAQLLGFENQQDFSRAFKRTTGFPPSYYRLHGNGEATTPTMSLVEFLQIRDKENNGQQR